jgi:magnesium transporter
MKEGKMGSRAHTAELAKQRSQKVGLAPGTLVHIGEKKTEHVRISIIDYDESQFQENLVTSPTEDLPRQPSRGVRWIDVRGLHQLEIIEDIGKQFKLHPLLLEDIVNTDQRPKLDDYRDYLSVVLKMLYRERPEDHVHVEQVTIILGPHYVISFQENGSDVFDAVRERLRTGKGRIRTMGADYLLYSLVDAIVDHYFVILETQGESIETLEEELLRNPTPEILRVIHAVKHELLFLRRAVWPLREVINGLQRGESALVRDATRVYLRDVYDHAVQVIDSIETFREMVSSMLDVYLSSISYRTNAVMKVLTIITTIFMPLTFIAGVYGMNFKYMPELEWRWAYPVALFVMAAIAFFMLVFFRKKHWL